MTIFNPVLHQILFSPNSNSIEKIWTIDRVLYELGHAGLIDLHIDPTTAPTDVTQLWLRPIAGGATQAAAYFWNGTGWATPLTPDALFEHLIFNGAIETAHIKDGAVTNAKHASFTAYSFLANNQSTAEAPIHLTSAATTYEPTPAPKDLFICFDALTGQIKKVQKRYIATIPGGSLTLFVRTGGNDATGDGTANSDAKAFESINGAIDYASANYNLSGKSLMIQLGVAGTYASFSVSGSAASITVNGNAAAQDSYIISGADGSSSACNTITGARVSINGVRLIGTAPTRSVLGAYYGSSVFLNDVSVTHDTTGQALIESQTNSIVTIPGALKFASGGSSALRALVGGVIDLQVTGSIVQNVNAHNYAQGYARAAFGGIITVGSGATIFGTATGPRFNSSYNGTINAFGLGAAFFPGSVAGTELSGGIYVP